MNPQNLRHLKPLRTFVGNLVEQSDSCDCLKPPSLLLVGPPGAGKTFLVKQMSRVCEMPLYGVHTDKVAGHQKIRSLFDEARDNYPSLVFMDDIDVIFCDQEKRPSCGIQVQFLREELFRQLGMKKIKINDPNSTTSSNKNQDQASNSNSGTFRASTPRPSAPLHEDRSDYEDEEGNTPDNHGIIVVAATNAPWLLYKDHEILSRFRGVYLVGLPDKQTRFNILRNSLEQIQHSLSDDEIWLAAEKTEGFTPADILILGKTLAFQQMNSLLELGHIESYMEESFSSTELQTPVSSTAGSTISKSTDCEDDEKGDEAGEELKGDVLLEGGGNMATAAAIYKMLLDYTYPPQHSASPVAGNSWSRGQGQGANNSKHSQSIRQAAPAGTPGPTSNHGNLEDDWESETEDEEEEEETPNKSVSDKSSQNKSTSTSHKLEGASPANTPPSSKTINPSSKLAKCDDKDDDTLEDDDEDDGEDDEVVPPQDVEESTTPLNRPPSVPSPDSAIELSKSSEELSIKNKSQFSSQTPDSSSESSNSSSESSNSSSESSSSSSGIVSSNVTCDSSNSSGIVEEDNVAPISDINTDDDVSKISTDSIAEEASKKENISEPNVPCNKDNKELSNIVPKSQDSAVGEKDSRVGSPAEFELFYEEPPDPIKDDNKDVDSDSENEGTDSTWLRSRRVAFGGMTTMEPLSVNVDEDNNCPPNVSVEDIPPSMKLCLNNVAGSMLANNALQDASTNAILRSLLARPSTIMNSLTGDDQSDGDDVLPDLEHRSNSAEALMGNFNNKKNNISNRQVGGSNIHNDLSVGSPNEATGLAPIVACALQGNKNTNIQEINSLIVPNARLTPTPSEGSSCAGTIGSSGSGTHASTDQNGPDFHKKRDSTSSYENSDGNNDRSDVSTATCNDAPETPETLECNTDCEERLQGLESGGEQKDDDDENNGAATPRPDLGSNEELHLDAFGLKVITLADVLDAISHAQPSVSNEEIKKYTDFMSWFAESAKSACVHGNSNSSKTDGSQVDTLSLTSSRCDTPSLRKKRKRKPLRKLGRFLLKALLFILD